METHCYAAFQSIWSKRGTLPFYVCPLAHQDLSTNMLESGTMGRNVAEVVIIGCILVGAWTIWNAYQPERQSDGDGKRVRDYLDDSTETTPRPKKKRRSLASQARS